MTGDLHPDAEAAADLARPATLGQKTGGQTAGPAGGDPVQLQLDELAAAHAAMQKVIEAQVRQIRALQGQVRTLTATEDGEPT